MIKTYNRMRNAFPGGPIPAIVAVSADDVTSPEVKAAIVDLRNQAASSPHFEQPITIDVSSDHTVAQVSIPLAGDGNNSQSTAALAALRDRIIPATIGAVPGAPAT